MDKEKLQVKLFKYLLGFTIIIMVILWLLQTVFLNQTYKFVRSKQLDHAIEYFNDNLNKMDISDIINNLNQDLDVTVELTTDYERPVIEYGYVRRDPPEALEKVVKFQYSDGSEMSITFFAWITPVDATISTIRFQLVVVSIIVMLLAVVFAVLISRRVSKPIEKLNESAKELSKGKLDTKFFADDYIEIKELSDTLNKTAVELSKLDQYRRELLANISHDLRTPLAVIYSYVEMMHDFPEEIDKENLDLVMDETMRLTNLVNDILDMTKIESVKQELNLSKYSITKSVEEIVNRISAMTEKQGYKITFERSEDVDIVADKIKIEQVIYNLLTNAITHSGERKEVIITQTLKKDKLVLSFLDFGEGIDEDDLENIWDRYYKSDKNHKRNVVGSGLGLSIVKNILDLHKGEYKVESKKGEYSKFTISLPLKTKKEQA